MNNHVQIDLSKTEAFKCACGNETFEALNFLRVVPAILSPTLKREIIPIPAFRCTRCKNLAELNKQNPKKNQ